MSLKPLANVALVARRAALSKRLALSPPPRADADRVIHKLATRLIIPPVSRQAGPQRTRSGGPAEHRAFSAPASLHWGVRHIENSDVLPI